MHETEISVKKKRHDWATLFLVAAVGLVVFVGPQIVESVKQQIIPTKNTTQFTQKRNTCIPFKSSRSNTKTVILRVDDVQAYSWGETTRKMVDGALRREIPLTLAIIPKGFRSDKQLVRFLNDRQCNLEFALHGWSHSVNGDYDIAEFGTLSAVDASVKITMGADALRSVTDEKIVTWVPPLNEQSKGTVEALEYLGFQYLSTEGNSRWDYDVSTFDYVTDSLVPPIKVVEVCKETFSTSDICIVMLHPQDFATGLTHDEDKYQTYYIDLLEQLQAQGYAFARFKDFPYDVP